MACASISKWRRRGRKSAIGTARTLPSSMKIVVGAAATGTIGPAATGTIGPAAGAIPESEDETEARTASRAIVTEVGTGAGATSRAAAIAGTARVAGHVAGGTDHAAAVAAADDGMTPAQGGAPAAGPAAAADGGTGARRRIGGDEPPAPAPTRTGREGGTGRGGAGAGVPRTETGRVKTEIKISMSGYPLTLESVRIECTLWNMKDISVCAQL